MSIVSNSPLVSSVFSEKISVSEKNKQQINNFIQRLIQKTAAAFAERKFEAFDPFPGDQQCQLRAMLLYSLKDNPALKEEVETLKEMSSVHFKKKGPMITEYSSFFAFLLRSYLLTVITRNSLPDKLNTISNLSQLNGDQKKDVILHNKSSLSREVPELFEKTFKQAPLEKKTTDNRQFVCHLQQMQQVFALFDGVIQLKDQMTKTTRFLQKKGTSVEEIDSCGLKGRAGLIFLGKDMDRIKPETFIEDILVLAAKERPFDKTSTVEELSGELREQTETLREKSPPFSMAHISMGVLA